MKSPVLIISELASPRDLERACFVWIKKCLHSARTSKRSCSCCTRPRGGSRVFVVEIGEGATPLCKQLTLVAVEGWVLGTVPWHVAFRPGRERAGQTEEASLGLEQEPSDAICRFLHSREEGDGESPRQVGPPPTSWRCDQHLPTARETFLSPLRQLTASIPFLSTHLFGGLIVRPSKMRTTQPTSTLL